MAGSLHPPEYFPHRGNEDQPREEGMYPTGKYAPPVLQPQLPHHPINTSRNERATSIDVRTDFVRFQGGWRSTHPRVPSVPRVSVCTRYGYGFGGFGYGLANADPRYTRVEPYEAKIGWDGKLGTDPLSVYFSDGG